MPIQLKKAGLADSQLIHQMQVEAFTPLLEKYGDLATNPAAETLEKTIQRLEHPATDYYLILLDQIRIGAIRVIRLANHSCRISPLFILPGFQGRGYAQAAIRLLDSIYPAVSWELSTIKQETGLCHLYEKMGFKKAADEKIIQDGLTLVHYVRQL